MLDLHMALKYSISGDAWCPAFDCFPGNRDWICKVLFQVQSSPLIHNIRVFTSDRQWPHQFDRADSILHRDAGFLGELSQAKVPPTETAAQAADTASKGSSCTGYAQVCNARLLSLPLAVSESLPFNLCVSSKSFLLSELGKKYTWIL